MDPFAGLADVAWERMTHAYGPATNLPRLIRELVDPDPRVREAALDTMYGAVHHQGDVYDSTLAAVPFLLRIAATGGLPGRDRVVELLASIGGADWPDTDDGEDDEDDPVLTPEHRDRLRAARRLVADGHEVFVRLLADDDPRVRAAAAGAVVVARTRAAGSMRALCDRFGDEEDVDVRVALVNAVARIARDGTDGRALAWLTRLVDSDQPTRVRLAALSGAAARTAVDVRISVELLARLYREGEAPSPSPAGGPTTGTLLGAVRCLSEREAGGRHAPHAARFVHAVSDSLGDRIDARVELLSALLRSPDGECRVDALAAVARLVAGWRGDYTGLVRLIGDLVDDGDLRVRSRALGVLDGLDVLAAPAGDALATALGDTPREAAATRTGHVTAWLVRTAAGPTAGPVVRALAAARDPRVLPALEWLLGHDDMPPDTGYLVGRLGTSAATLLPGIRRRLRTCAGDVGARHRSGLLYALRQMGRAAADALPEVRELPVTVDTADVLGAIGAAAATEVPRLRAAATSDDLRLAAAAAGAVHRVAGDPGPALAAAGRLLDVDPDGVGGALRLLAQIGPAAAPLVDRLRPLVARGGRLAATAALLAWRTDRDTDAVIPVLEAQWRTRSRRPAVVAAWREIGAPAAASARPRLRSELADVRRHNARRALVASSIADDLALLAACRAELARWADRPDEDVAAT